MDSYRETAGRIRFFIEHVERTLQADRRQAEQALFDLSTQGKKAEELEKVLEVVKYLQEQVSEKTVAYLNTFLSEGLRIVFPEKEVTVYIRVGDHGVYKTAEVWMREEVDGYVVDRPLKGNFGGGLQVVVAPLLQVLVILDKGLERVLFLDEQFTQVSMEYQDGLFNFLRLLIERFEFKILLVTQQDSFTKRADQVYYMRNGRVKLMESYNQVRDRRAADHEAALKEAGHGNRG